MTRRTIRARPRTCRPEHAGRQRSRRRHPRDRRSLASGSYCAATRFYVIACLPNVEHVNTDIRKTVEHVGDNAAQCVSQTGRNSAPRFSVPRSRSAPENGDARLPQTLPDALRDLSPLPPGAAARPAQCMAHRPALTLRSLFRKQFTFLHFVFRSPETEDSRLAWRLDVTVHRKGRKAEVPLGGPRESPGWPQGPRGRGGPARSSIVEESS
jgi:hypothetical protein